MNELDLPTPPPLPAEVRERALNTVLSEIDAPPRRRTAPLVAAAVVVMVLGAATAVALSRSPSPEPGELGVATPPAVTPSMVAPPPVESDVTATPDPSSDTPSTVAPTPVEPDPPATSGPGSDTPAAGSIESATVAVREACRRFYGYNLDQDLNTVPLSEPELHQRCDLAPIRWVGDCYAPRPPQFIPGSGGCARLSGYLAVYHGPPIDGDQLYLFPVGDDSWTIHPESD